MIGNNIDLKGIINEDGSVKTTDFNRNFCINFSIRMQFLVGAFGDNAIMDFIKNQMSAGKQNYDEDAFFEALSEVSVLSFYVGRYKWEQSIYEPPVEVAVNGKNPEARFIGTFYCQGSAENLSEEKRTVTINIEVKSPKFPHDNHKDEKIAIPTVSLTLTGREEVKSFCTKHNVLYLAPRILKLRDFINSAAGKFKVPKEDEFNLLYINWSYRDFPSNGFLEAWSLLTNKLNGVLTHPEFAVSIGVLPDAFEKITAVIVYTESLEGLMFSDFRYVWQRKHAGAKFRMWVVNEKLRNAEWKNESNVLFRITGMNPDKELTQMVMVDCKPKIHEEKAETAIFVMELVELISKNVINNEMDTNTEI